MRIFITDQGHYSKKLNIVDENNVFVGFDYSDSCCESYGFIIANSVEELHGAEHYHAEDEKSHTAIDKWNGVLAHYTFDTTFHEVVPSADEWCEGAIGVFKAVCGAKPAIYIGLFNYHNGYYSHGFEMHQGETELFSGHL